MKETLNLHFLSCKRAIFMQTLKLNLSFGCAQVKLDFVGRADLKKYKKEIILLTEVLHLLWMLWIAFCSMSVSAVFLHVIETLITAPTVEHISLAESKTQPKQNCSWEAHRLARWSSIIYMICIKIHGKFLSWLTKVHVVTLHQKYHAFFSYSIML